MINLLAGLVIGAILGLFIAALLNVARRTDDEKAPSAVMEERLNGEKKDREQMLKEQERQFDNMMRYTGEEQKK